MAAHTHVAVGYNVQVAVDTKHKLIVGQMRGLEKVRGEFSLTALAYNLRRVHNITKFAELMAAVQS
jgi:hypothetical protein